MTYAFFSFPLSGHNTPHVELVRALVGRGETVYYYTSKALWHRFNDVPELRLMAYPEPFQSYFDSLSDKHQRHGDLIYMMHCFYKAAALLIDFCLLEIPDKNIDYVIVDSFSIYARIACKVLGVPMCKVFPSIIGDKTAVKNSGRMQAELIKMIAKDFWHLIGIFIINLKFLLKYKNTVKLADVMSPEQDLTLVMTSKTFHPGSDQYGKHVHFLGADHKRTHFYRPSEREGILASMGSVLQHEGFYETCAEATKDLDCTLYVILGPNMQSTQKALEAYPHVTLLAHLSLDAFREKIAKSKVFITHGGYNSIQNGLLYCTPMLIRPFSPEQSTNAYLVEKANCGKQLTGKGYNAKNMKMGIQALLNDPEIEGHLRIQSDALSSGIGIEKAIDLLQEDNLRSR